MDRSKKLWNRRHPAFGIGRLVAFGMALGFFVLRSHASSNQPEPINKSPAKIVFDQEKIQQLLDRLMAADNASDVDQIMSFYADDAMTMPPNDHIVIGKAAIAARYKAGFAKFKMEVSLTSDELEICGDWAFNRGKTNGRLIWHDGGNPTPLNDKYLMILRRQADKSWKIARLMWSNYPQK
jgi:uncharacterized protein (TIGR02246 family)